MRAAVDTPAGLVGVQTGGRAELVGDLLVPGPQRLGHAAPGRHQPAGGDRRVERGAEDLTGLFDRQAQPVVKVAGEGDDVVAQRGVRQRVGDDLLDVFFAVLAVVAVDRVLGDDRLDVLRNVFDDAGAGASAALQLAAATGAGGQPVLDAGVDLRWRRPARADVADLGPRLLASGPGGLGFKMHGHGGRGRGRGDGRGLHLGHASGERQRDQDDGLGPHRIKCQGLFAGQFATESRVEDDLDIGRLDGGGCDPRLSTSIDSIAQCLTSAEHGDRPGSSYPASVAGG